MLAPNSNVGRYRILAPIAAGGMGEVYRASDERLGREVAIKVLPSSMARDADLIRRFEQEARAAGALNHPNIIAVYDTGVQENAHFLVLELLDGQTLRELLSYGPLPVRKAIEFAEQLATGLAAAHEKGIIHRDLKPENVFISRDEQLKILDFGLARVLTPARLLAQSQVPTTPVTHPGSVMGTVGYMSPEQIRGEDADQRSDIFSLGAIVYEMLTGQRAFRRATAIETLNAIVSEDPRDAATIVPGIPPTVERIVTRCLEKKPDARFHSARDVGFMLEAISGVRESQPAEVRPKTRNIFLAVLAVIAVAGAATVGYVASHSTGRTAPTFQRLSYQRGQIEWAAFAPDGQTVVYEIVSGGPRWETYSVMASRPEARALGFEGMRILSISRRGDLAVQLEPRTRVQGVTMGTLAIVPLTGGSPRELMQQVEWADWAPDGRELAVVRASGGVDQLEFPPGKVLYRTNGWIASPRFAPQGNRIAFLVHPTLGDDRGELSVIDLTGKELLRTQNWSSVQGLAWNPAGDQVWFTAATDGIRRALYSAGLRGTTRLLMRVPASLIITDISSDRRALLISTEGERIGMLAGSNQGERDLSWLDASIPQDILVDGSAVLFQEAGEAGGNRYGVFVRGTDGSPPIRLGDGMACSFAPDGQSVVAVTIDEPRQLLRVPVRAGDVVRLTNDNASHSWGQILPNQQLLFYGAEPGHGFRFFVSDLHGEHRQTISPEGFSPMVRVSHHGDRATSKDVATHKVMLLHVDGSPPVEVKGTTTHDTAVGWTDDDRAIYVADFTRFPLRIDTVDLTTGSRKPWHVLQPADQSILTIVSPYISADGRRYVYGYFQNSTTLYEASGVE